MALGEPPSLYEVRKIDVNYIYVSCEPELGLEVKIGLFTPRETMAGKFLKEKYLQQLCEVVSFIRALEP